MVISNAQLANQLSAKDQSPKYYRHYAKLFAPYFEEIEEKSVERLCDAGYLYYQSTLLMDRIIDDRNFSDIPTSIILQEQTIKTLTALYGEDSEFWKFWQARRLEYFKAVEIEKKLNQTQNAEFDVYADLADKKAAFGKVAIDCIWFLSNQKQKNIYEDLLASHKLFSIGFQLFDDIRDFKEDMTKGQFNWGVYLLTQQVDVNEYGKDATILNKLFYLKGIAQELFKLSVQHFQKALDIIESIQIESEWRNTIVESKKAAIRDLDITDHYINAIKRKVDVGGSSSNENFFDYNLISDGAVSKGLDYIHKQFKEYYIDLKHRMYLGKIDGFDNTDQVHESDTFPRALLNDCLFSISKRYKINISKFINNECKYFLEQRNMDEVGGWGYFPTVKEIAADIDDLAQVMQLFIHSGQRDLINQFCSKPIEIALTERANEDGGIETWIIPKHNQTDTQRKQELFNETRWGKGPDIEVVANFIYALHLTESSRYEVQIEKSLNYIINHQKEAGHWESVWYYGDYYGTYVCLRLLSLFGSRFSSNILMAIEYIRKHQNQDGGFGLASESNSDPLSTSLAILAYGTFIKQKDNTIKEAIDYLLSCQLEDGSWSEVDFIKPKLLEPYKSKTMTTGYALKALTQYI